MGRSTFDGPVISGNQRFGALRNIGYTSLVQQAVIDVTNTTANTANYGGASGQFAVSNAIPNGNGVVYQPSATVYPPIPQTIPADSATNIYRGWVAYLPINSTITGINIAVGVVPTVGGSGTLTSMQVLVSNNYTAAAGTAAYGQTAVVTSPAVGPVALATPTATQLANLQATTSDITNSPLPALFSQVVFTVALVGTTLTTVTAGKFYFNITYIQADGNIGSTTAYPYGNFD